MSKLSSEECNYIHNLLWYTDDFEEHLECSGIYLKAAIVEMRRKASDSLIEHYSSIRKEKYDFSVDS